MRREAATRTGALLVRRFRQSGGGVFGENTVRRGEATRIGHCGCGSSGRVVVVSLERRQ